MFLGLTSENSAPDGFPDHRLRHNSSAIWGHVLPSAIIWKIRASFALKRMVFVLRHPTAPSGACGSATVIPRPRPAPAAVQPSFHGPVRGICPPVSGQWLSKARSQEAASHPLLRSWRTAGLLTATVLQPAAILSLSCPARSGIGPFCRSGSTAASHLPASATQQLHTQTLTKW